MRGIGTQIRAHRRSLGLTLEALATRAGCTKGYLSSIETGRRRRPPSASLLRRLESALGLERGALLTEGWWVSTPEEVREALRGLERRTRAAAQLAELVLREGRARGVWSPELERLAVRVSEAAGWGAGDEEEGLESGHGERTGRAAVINRVEEGYPSLTEEWRPWRTARGHVSAPMELAGGSFAVRVVGDEMEPAYLEGDVVVVEPAEAKRSGRDCFVSLFEGAETMFRRVYFEAGSCGSAMARLQPLNPARAARVVPATSVSGVWEAAYVLRRARAVGAGEGEGCSGE
jgi:transcriptional regulator with XRE-family HTH domain